MRPYPLLLGFVLGAACVAGAPGIAGEAPRDIPELHEIIGAVDPAALKATLTTLVGFGTRHTLSDPDSDTRGIGAARRWVQRRFGEISAGCAAPLQIVTPTQTVTGPRVPEPTPVVDVVAIQRGTAEPDRVILITAHVDSRVSDPQDARRDAPGANDDASGVAAVLEAARVLCTHRWRATLVYGVLSGEEQNLYGGQILADYAREQGWQVEADLNNDIIGNSHGTDGRRDARHVRVFSEGTRSLETPEQASRRRLAGGEVDSPSRSLARYLQGLAARYLHPFQVQLVYRTDRYGRGGDQEAFLAHGYPAVRLTEAHENYAHQHQDVRTEAGVDFGDTLAYVDLPYLALVTRLNLLALASMAGAPAPPRGVSLTGAVSSDTTVHWQGVPGAAGYRVWWRDTTQPLWTHSRYVAAAGDAAGQLVLPGTVIDDWFFGVAAVSAEGYESPVVFPAMRGRSSVASALEHYATHLAPIYLWMAGGEAAALAAGDAEVQGLGLPRRAGDLIVDLGAGFGMHALALARRGARVLAIDSSAELLGELQRLAAGLAVRCVHGDLLAFAQHLEAAPAALVCLGDTLTHLPDFAALDALLARAARALAGGGTLVITLRDYTRPLQGDARFIAVRSDAERILTCFLEYEPEHVVVHDIVQERGAAGWQQRVSHYRKLRIAPDRLAAALQALGFTVRTQPGERGMVRVVAERP